MKSTKRYLRRYREACDELDALAEEHDRIISNLMSMTANYDGEGGSSGPKDKVGDGVAQLVDHCTKIDEEIKCYIAVRDDVRSIVREVMHENITLGQCLHYRYIMGWEPTVAAMQMNYTDRQERNIHRKALECAQRIIDRRSVAQSFPQISASTVIYCK